MVVNLTTRGETPSLTEVQAILHTHEMRLMQISSTAQFGVSTGTSSGSQTMMANTVSKDSKTNNGGKFKGKYKFGNKQKVICQLCGITNHVASKCYKRFDPTFLGLDQKPPQSPSSNTGQPSAQANTAQVFNRSNNSQSTGSSSDWFVDSGATHHITSQLGNLNLSTPYQGTSKLVVGNGSTVPIMNVGSMEISTMHE